MLHPFIHARLAPAKPALTMAGSGKTVGYAELESRANRTARLLREIDIGRGDTVAGILDNDPAIFEFAWAADRAGCHYVPISTRLTAEEAAYIVNDSGARVVFASAGLMIAADLPGHLANGPALLMAGEGLGGWRSWDAAVATLSDQPIADEAAGGCMFYSSGTTGRPKGIKWPLPGDMLQPPFIAPLLTGVYGATSDSVYLSPAPLYHAAPLVLSMTMQRLGSKIVVMESFDPEAALAAIERHRVTLAQFVPTHFIRMLRLPDAVKARYDLSSLTCVFHAAAPCPIEIKRAMIDWLGPIVHEYYSGSEGIGATIISPKEWLERPGSVGRVLGGAIHACDERGEPLPSGREGVIYFAGGQACEYHNDPAKSAEMRNAHGWGTLGDIGIVDADGYLFLTDRSSFMIISGGVNIYPQEIENVLAVHPKVADVAVIGAPDADFGERVVAVVQPIDMADATPAFAAELQAYCRGRLSGVKVPRQVDFAATLPRHDTGKLYKRLLRDQYREAAA
ncbi:acyl-CoA synthetase [uncultured Sphingomonas sp.]|uniref:acyl-CoA synthetase n=1 Tax=uncultured Sphingomonas sp. TaxID=158754 RepID=UPI0035CAF870